jgi:hypothetical protein
MSQRDQLAGPMAPDPAHELAMLRNAVRAHRDVIYGASWPPDHPDRADLELWRHIGEEGSRS